MIEKYIVMDGPDKGRIHDESIAWDLAHVEYELREKNDNQPVLSNIINAELKKLINDRVAKQIDGEFDVLKDETNEPKVNLIKDIVSRREIAADLLTRRNAELREAGESAVKQLSIGFAELMTESGVPSFEFIVDDENLGPAWLVREYRPYIPARNEYEGMGNDSPEVTGIVILQNGDMHKFWGYSRSPERSHVDFSAFEAHYKNSNGNYQEFKYGEGSVVKYLSEIARRHKDGAKIEYTGTY